MISVYYNSCLSSSIYLLQESFNRLSYLLDVFTFTQDDMSLNSTVLNWPNNIAPIFDQNDEVNIKVLPMKIRELTLCKDCHVCKIPGIYGNDCVRN